MKVGDLVTPVGTFDGERREHTIWFDVDGALTMPAARPDRYFVVYSGMPGMVANVLNTSSSDFGEVFCKVLFPDGIGWINAFFLTRVLT